MWSISSLKINAKKHLKETYWTAFFVIIILTIVMKVFAYNQKLNVFYYLTNPAFDKPQDIFYVLSDYFSSKYEMLYYYLPEIAKVYIPILPTFTVVFRLFLINPFKIGATNFFMNNQVKKGKVADLFSGFRKNNYLNIVFVMFLKELFIFFWTLLFIVPGIIKHYEYKMVPYIIAENPNINSKRAFQISKNMMCGQKMGAFILDLSFIGWYILCLLTFGVGFVFLKPYLKQTSAELWYVLRNNVFAANMVTAADLPQYTPFSKDDNNNSSKSDSDNMYGL